MDNFTKIRLMKMLEDWKKNHGKDISANELDASGFDQEVIKKAVHEKIMVKYQITTENGATENRYKLLKDWKSLNK